MSVVEKPRRGQIIYVGRYSRDEIRRHPERLYVFGDNVSTLGRGGQARECRGEPNTVGIPTKWHPMMDDESFFCDADLPTIVPRIKAEFRRLDAHLASGGDVVWPSDGVGTGLAQLPRRAPAIAAYIQRCLAHLSRHTIDAALDGEG
ncbi:hypothetical protein [Sphingobium sp. CFD-2]|uniref:DUF7831 domain-containing protein n=1 Tax=Sphingobium sp. CFD-2 TaxID=2878542 RepID=UPI00214C3785|nr:hypothetical protein [Sphingobium sp. CFD-2]